MNSIFRVMFLVFSITYTSIEYKLTFQSVLLFLFNIYRIKIVYFDNNIQSSWNRMQDPIRIPNTYYNGIVQYVYRSITTVYMRENFNRCYTAKMLCPYRLLNSSVGHLKTVDEILRKNVEREHGRRFIHSRVLPYSRRENRLTYIRPFLYARSSSHQQSDSGLFGDKGKAESFSAISVMCARSTANVHASIYSWWPTQYLHYTAALRIWLYDLNTYYVLLHYIIIFQ